MRYLASLIGLSLFGTIQLRADWNQFRGPKGQGVASDLSEPPVKLGEKSLAWKVPVPAGLSSPVIAGENLFLTGLEGGRLVTLCFNRATGAERWRKEAPEVPLEKVHETSSPATPTPYATSDRLFVYFGSYGVIAYDFDGKEVWKKQLTTPASLYGTASSPVVFRDLLILVIDSDANLDGSKLSQSKLIALKTATGDLAWETGRPLVRSGWSTPTLWEHGSEVELVALGMGRVTGYDPATGAEKWHATGFSKETIATPVWNESHLFVSSAQLGGGADEKLDPMPYWEAVMRFDTNKDGKLQRAEMTRPFTFPLRPELPSDHPGFGIPMPDDETKRAQRLDGMVGWVDKDKDGAWTKEEFIEHMASKPSRPLLMALKPGGSGDVTASHVAWEGHRHIPEIPSPLCYRDQLYLIRNGGLLATLSASEGKLLYSERLKGGGQYSASPIAANGHIYLASNRGQLSVVKAGSEFQQVSDFALDEPIYVTPAIEGSTIYVRTEKSLVALSNQKN